MLSFVSIYKRYNIVIYIYLIIEMERVRSVWLVNGDALVRSNASLDTDHC